MRSVKHATGHSPPAFRECNGSTFDTEPVVGQGVVFTSTIIWVLDDRFADEAPSVSVANMGEDPSVRVTARVREAPDLRPGDEVEFVEKQYGVFVFDAV
jgi:uncharacterized OB-fold protein